MAYLNGQLFDARRLADEREAEYHDLLERAVKLAIWYGHDLDAALGEHVSNAGVYRPPGASNQESRPK